MRNMKNCTDLITEKLQILSPSHLEVIDESSLHHGHRFAIETGKTSQTHFKLIIQSAELSQLTNIQAHRRIYEILAEELKTQIHALSIAIKK